ncbi:MAG: radical SAM protein, partial [Nanoarchaeota archaeon]|nr:radical SAM protein [Nanoarchaeota archaeon]
MKIVLVSTNLRMAESNIPLGICYIASYLISKGYDVSIIDRDDNPVEKILELNPDIAGFSTTSSTYWKTVEWATEIKKQSNITTVIGGSHITTVKKLDECFDAGVIGEGELAMEDIINGKRGLVTKPFIENLDMLPFPACDLVDMKYYTIPRTGCSTILEKSMDVFTSRGCPFRCVFCSAEAIWKRRVRYFSPEYVNKHIRRLVDTYKLEHINIIDDTFALDIGRVRKFADILPKNVSYTIQIRADVFDDERCKLFKRMNVREIMVGFESGNQRILDYLKCNTVKVEDNKRTIMLCKKYGFGLYAHIIIGSPTETKKDMLETLELVEDDGVSMVGINVLTPMPGTQLWEELKQKGMVSDDMDFKKFDFANDSRYTDMKDRIHIASISPEELLEMVNFFRKELEYKNLKFKFTPSKLFMLGTWKKILRNP